VIAQDGALFLGRSLGKRKRESECRRHGTLFGIRKLCVCDCGSPGLHRSSLVPTCLDPSGAGLERPAPAHPPIAGGTVRVR
jgi:hypothetical protein